MRQNETTEIVPFTHPVDSRVEHTGSGGSGTADTTEQHRQRREPLGHAGPR